MKNNSSKSNYDFTMNLSEFTSELPVHVYLARKISVYKVGNVVKLSTSDK